MTVARLRLPPVGETMFPPRQAPFFLSEVGDLTGSPTPPPHAHSPEAGLSSVRRILVATDRSETAEHAVQFAADMAVRFEAELLLCQIVIPPAEAPPTHRRP